MEYIEKIRILAKEYRWYEDLLKKEFTFEEVNRLEDLLRCAVLYKIREKVDIEKIFWLKENKQD